MAPIRRYLRITKHSVLEVRIYLDRPSDAESWLIRRDNPALPRVIQAVRPLVLPKLREENERAKGTKARKKGVKDVVVDDDFEVSIFLTELSSRHSLLTKQKEFKERPRIQSNSGKLTGWLTSGTKEQPVVLPEDGDHRDNPIVLREEDPDRAVNLDDIPEVSDDQGENPPPSPRPSRRKRTRQDKGSSSDGEASDSDGEYNPRENATSKRQRRDQESEGSETESQDDKKKMGLNTSYDGFSIYGRILCLVVKRKGLRASTGGGSMPVSSQQMLENWVSTQAAAELVDEDD